MTSSGMYHLLSKLPRGPSSLSTVLRTTTLVAGHVAAGDLSSVIAAFQSLPDADDVRDNAYDLAVLQSAAFVGFPKVLTAAAALQQAGIVGARPGTEPRGAGSREEGAATFDAVYGRAAGKIRGRISACHPDLDAWVMDFVYGRVLSGAGPTLRERELCAVAVLSGGGGGTEPLLVSHCRGALRVGATPEELRAVIDQTGEVFGAEAAERAEAVWVTYERTRSAL